MKAGTLQLTVDRLNGALAKVEESEGTLRSKVQSLTDALAQSNASLTSTQDKNLHLQKTLSTCEHDRQVLQVWGGRVPGSGIFLSSIRKEFSERVSREQQVWREVIASGTVSQEFWGDSENRS